MNRRWLAWWFFAEDVVAHLANPRTDASAADADVRAAIRASRLFASGQTLVDAVENAWRGAAVRRPVEWVARAWREWSLSGCIRAIGACTSVAATTVLMLQIVESPEAGPFRWILPVSFGVLGAAVAAAADPIARAWGDRQA